MSVDSVYTFKKIRYLILPRLVSGHLNGKMKLVLNWWEQCSFRTSAGDALKTGLAAVLEWTSGLLDGSPWQWWKWMERVNQEGPRLPRLPTHALDPNQS
jgi:hypothetical protein